MNVVIAGGSGFLGTYLTKHFTDLGWKVSILSRNPSESNQIYWSPTRLELDKESVRDCQVLINLSGQGIDEKRWTEARKQALRNSRIESTNALFKMADKFPALEHYVSASGISAYGFDDGNVLHEEADSYGQDFLSQLVKDWEAAADQFNAVCKVTQVRIAVVLDKENGALPKLVQPIQYGVGAPIGTGTQMMPWVHIEDLVRIFQFVIESQLTGKVNSNAENNTNKEVTQTIANVKGKRLWLPNIPAFILKLLFGQLAEILLNGASASNEKLKKAGFEFKFKSLESALNNLLK